MSDIKVDPKRNGIKAVLIGEFKMHAPLGSCIYKKERARLSFVCPGCGKWCGIGIGIPKQDARDWDVVSGNPEKPETLTATPSILHYDCGWHGYLKNGVFESC